MQTAIYTPTQLSDLLDVSVAGINSGDVLVWDGTTFSPQPLLGGGLTFADIDGTISIDQLPPGSVATLDTIGADALYFFDDSAGVPKLISSADAAAFIGLSLTFADIGGRISVDQLPDGSVATLDTIGEDALYFFDDATGTPMLISSAQAASFLGLSLTFADINGMIAIEQFPDGTVTTLDSIDEDALYFFDNALFVPKLIGASDTRTFIGIDTDITLAANSDDRIPSQKAVKAYVDAGGGGTGDVVGPGVAVNNHVVFFDGTTGKLIKDSGLALSGSNTGDQDLSGYVPTTRTVNGHALSSNVTVTPTDLALVIGTNVQAWDADLDTWATKTPYAGTLTITTAKTFNVTNTLTLSGTDSSTLNVGAGGTLGSAAYTASSAYDVAGAAAAAQAASQPLDSDLTTIAGLTPTTNNFIVSVSSAWASRTPTQVKTTLAIANTDVSGLGTLSTQNGTFSGTSSGTNTGDQIVPSTLANVSHKWLNSYDASTGSFTQTQPASGDISGLGTLATQSGTFSGTSSGTNTGDQTITLTGDVTGSGTGSFSTTIAVGAVTDAKGSLMVKPAVAVVAVANITLSGEQTIDGQLTATSLVLATAQSTGSQNGPWVSAAGAWARPGWYTSGSTTQAAQFLTTFVRLGTTYQGSTWRMTTASVTIDTTSTTWVQTPTNINSVTGSLALSSLTASTSLALGVGTIELGHASDTTIARSGAGAITVEGVQVILSGAALGTPASGTLTNCTSLPISGLTGSTSTALGVGSIELGAASDTTLARVSAGVASIEGVTIATSSNTLDLSNKRISLANGSTSVSPILMGTGGSLLTTPTAGAFEADSTVAYYTHASNERGVLAAMQFQRLASGSDYTLASQTAAQKIFNSTTNGAITLAANTTYYFVCVFGMTGMSGTSGSFGFALGGGASISNQFWMSYSGKTAGAINTPFAVVSTFNTAANTTLISNNTATVGHCRIEGHVSIGNSGGTIIPQVSLTQANAAVVKAGSYCYFWPVGADTLTNIGNWS